ncbi:hypothetical protein HYZ64_01185 [Candidatus Berkelbacteria bacterium]|nr:hypothetical protein [Candidatus Berkelbacteria bacterium]
MFWWVLGIIVVIAVVGYYFSVRSPQGRVTTTESGSAKGVLVVRKPQPKDNVVHPMLVAGAVQNKKGAKGTLTIELKQKESGVVVASKTAEIDGLSDSITFNETLQVALPAVPQDGELIVTFKDASGQGLEDTVTVPVYFPSDLERGR